MVTPTYYLDDRPKWRPYTAWHPVWTEDKGMVWAWPWKRVQMYHCYPEEYDYGIVGLDGLANEPLSIYALDPHSIGETDVYTP